MALVFGGPGVGANLRGQPSNILTLQAGNTQLIPAGTWGIQPSALRYINLQQMDQITGIWRTIGALSTYAYVNSDGNNYRVANQTGCVVGAYLTNAGSAYTSAPTVTVPATSGAKLNAVAMTAAHLVNTSPTITNGGSNYVYAPIVSFAAPPAGGVQASGFATLASGAVSSITVTNQGAGYTSPPIIFMVNDPRDTAGGGAMATCTLTGAGTIGAVLVTDFGSPVSVVPTITFAGGGGTAGAATAVMELVMSAYTITSGGSGYVGNVLVTGLSTPYTGSGTNPTIQSNLVNWRQCWIDASLWSSSSLTATGQTVYDGGLFPTYPKGYVLGWSNGSAAQVAFTGSGVTDTVIMLAV